ncbi:hypothetical protein Ciccas_004796 [Cichlidogyrus casuarinus]|uniref:Uncharacterized protein n=1 Tax=Cichlidogyrus casuarinus TaxID=1844966 RepID=A0ABD2QBB5_9PLAT
MAMTDQQPNVMKLGGNFEFDALLSLLGAFIDKSKIEIWKRAGFGSSTKCCALEKLFNYLNCEEIKEIFKSTTVPVFDTLKTKIKADVDKLKTYETLEQKDLKGTFGKLVDTALIILLNGQLKIEEKVELLEEVGEVTLIYPNPTEEEQKLLNFVGNIRRFAVNDSDKSKKRCEKNIRVKKYVAKSLWKNINSFDPLESDLKEKIRKFIFLVLIWLGPVLLIWNMKTKKPLGLFDYEDPISEPWPANDATNEQLTKSGKGFRIKKLISRLMHQLFVQMLAALSVARWRRPSHSNKRATDSSDDSRAPVSMLLEINDTVVFALLA